MDMESVLKDLVDAWKLANDMDNAMRDHGFDNNPYFMIGGGIADAIYKLLCEHTDTFEKSVTYWALYSGYMERDERVRLLLDAYKKTHP